MNDTERRLRNCLEEIASLTKTVQRDTNAIVGCANEVTDDAARWRALSPTVRGLLSDLQDVVSDKETNVTTLEEDVIKTLGMLEAALMADLHANVRER